MFEVVIMIDKRVNLYLHAQAHAQRYGVDLESVGVVEFTGTAVLKSKEGYRTNMGMGTFGRSDPGKSDLEKKVDVPFRLEFVDEALRYDVEERLVTMDQRDYVAPLRLDVWDKADDYFQNRPAKFSGFADGSKIEELGLYNPDKEFIRVYSDGGFTLPGKMKKEAAAPPGMESGKGEDMPDDGSPETGSGSAGGTPSPGGLGTE